MARARHRKHRPAEIGPRIFRRGRYQWIDMRPFGGDRLPIRDPKHPNWPHDGDRTIDAETAQRWAWAYLDLHRIDAKQRHLGLRGPARPLGAEVTRFLGHQERTKSAKTGVTQNAPLAVHFVPFVGVDVATDTVDLELVQRWVDHLLAKGYAVSTIGSYLTVVRTFFRWRSKGAHDPTRGAALPDPGERDVEPWTDDELARLRTAADKLDATEHATGPASQLRSFRLALELAIGTGARIAELAALEWHHFDANERTVRIRAQIPPDGYGTGLQPLKGRRNRTTLVLPSWWDHHQVDAPPGRILLAAGVETTSHRAITRYFSTIIEAAQLKRPGVNAHSFRHTYARIALESGARLEELQKFLGHASIRTTEISYGWLTEQAATTLARARIYGEQLRVIRPSRHRRVGGAS